MKEVSYVSSVHVRKRKLKQNEKMNKDLIKNYMAQAVAHLCKNTQLLKLLPLLKVVFQLEHYLS